MTGFSLLIFFGIPAAMMFIAISEQSISLAAVALALFLLFSAVVLLTARYYLLRGYTVSPKLLIVHRLGPDLHLTLKHLVSVDYDPKAMDWTLAMTNGGFFSFGGKTCWNRRLGRYEAYATDPKRSVVLEFSGRKLVVTPHDPRAFADSLNAWRNQQETAGSA